MTGVIKVTAPVTAGLSDFEIEPLENANAVINWKTNAEKDIAYYSIQRSTDGENFREIGKIKSKGNSDATQLYHYIDNNVGDGNKFMYYMLEVIDKKGNRQSSEIRMFTHEVTTAKLVTGISPNPVSIPGHLMIQFNADNEGKMRVELFNNNGELVQQTEFTAVKGFNNGHFHLANITPGSYYVVCTLGTMKEKQIIIVK
jgi:hypothetical protein